jgi:hypothetical protein
MTTYPKGTTKEQWDQYELDLHNHTNWCDSRMQFAETVIKMVQIHGYEKAYELVKRIIDETRSMNAPNKPGYYRANND